MALEPTEAALQQTLATSEAWIGHDAMAPESKELFTPALDERLRAEAEQRAAGAVQHRALLRARQERAVREVPSITPAVPAAAPVLGQTA
jgi:hypothetical protein